MLIGWTVLLGPSVPPKPTNNNIQNGSQKSAKSLPKFLIWFCVFGRILAVAINKMCKPNKNSFDWEIKLLFPSSKTVFLDISTVWECLLCLLDWGSSSNPFRSLQNPLSLAALSLSLNSHAPSAKLVALSSSMPLVISDRFKIGLWGYRAPGFIF